MLHAHLARACCRVDAGSRLQIDERCLRASFDVAPVDSDTVHQGIDAIDGFFVAGAGEVGIADGSEDGMVTEDFLNIEDAHPRFD